MYSSQNKATRLGIKLDLTGLRYTGQPPQQQQQQQTRSQPTQRAEGVRKRSLNNGYHGNHIDGQVRDGVPILEEEEEGEDSEVSGEEGGEDIGEVSGEEESWPGTDATEGAGTEESAQRVVTGHGLYLPKSIREHKQLEVALLQLALEERRQFINQVGTRSMIDRLRSDPAAYKGVTFELQLTTDRGGLNPTTHMRIPKLPCGLCRKVIRREKVTGGNENEAGTRNGLDNTLQVRRMSTESGFRGKAPLTTSRRSSSACDGSTSGSTTSLPGSNSEDASRRQTLPLVRLDWDLPKGQGLPLPFYTFPVSMKDRPLQAGVRRPSSSLDSTIGSRGKAVKVIYI